LLTQLQARTPAGPSLAFSGRGGKAATAFFGRRRKRAPSRPARLDRGWTFPEPPPGRSIVLARSAVVLAVAGAALFAVAHLGAGGRQSARVASIAERL